MTDIVENIEKELEAKSIEKPNITMDIEEKEDIPEQTAKPAPKKSKKVRSQAQIEAFERARLKRKENY